jgi:hypothetical protein
VPRPQGEISLKSRSFKGLCWLACYQRVHTFAQNMMARIFLVLTQRFGIPGRSPERNSCSHSPTFSHKVPKAGYIFTERLQGSLYPTLRTAVTPRMCHSRFVLALVLSLLLRESLP